MDVSSGIAKCEERLCRTHDALSYLLNAANFAEAERGWSEFLSASGAFYSKVEQLCKSNSKDHAWFGQIKKERKDDELLSYIHHARNSDEHTISDITKIEKTTTVLTGIYNIANDPLKGAGKDYVQAFELSTLPTPSLVLLPVHDDRYGDTFAVPGRHLDQLLIDWSPQAVAQLAFAYLARMLDVARALVS